MAGQRRVPLFGAACLRGADREAVLGVGGGGDGDVARRAGTGDLVAVVARRNDGQELGVVPAVLVHLRGPRGKLYIIFPSLLNKHFIIRNKLRLAC